MSGDVLRKLASIGLTLEQSAAVMDLMAEEAEKRKAKARERVQRWREKKRDETPCNVTERSVAQQPGSREGVRVEDNLPTKNLAGQEDKVVAAPSAQPTKRATRLPADWTPDIEFATSLGLSVSQAHSEATKFREWWPAQPGQKGVKADWGLTWKTWCRKAAESRVPSRRPDPPPKTIGEMFHQDARNAGITYDEQPPSNLARRVEARDGSGQGRGVDGPRHFAIPPGLLGRA